MESPVTELKRAREQKRMSLSDIADATLINIRFLEEIERGNYSFLPQTYVRAFLREYALMVELSPDEVLRSYESRTVAQAPAPPVNEQELPPPEPPPPPAVPQDRKEGPSINPTMALVALVVIGVLAVVVALWNIMDTETPAAVREIPFDSVREEQARGMTADSGKTAAIRPPAAVPVDTLVLTALASDSVWMQVVIDNAPARNIFLKRDGKGTWKAAKRFMLTLGNAGAVEFTLNKKKLGKLGQPGSVVKNIEFTHSTLTQK